MKKWKKFVAGAIASVCFCSSAAGWCFAKVYASSAKSDVNVSDTGSRITITYLSDGGKVILADGADKAQTGEIVQFTIVPEAGYQPYNVEVFSEDGPEIIPDSIIGGTEFTVTLPEKKIHIQVEFEPTDEMAVMAAGEDGITAYAAGLAHGTTKTTYNAGQENYLGVKSGITRERVLTWLNKHISDNYYLGTPYSELFSWGGDNRNPNGDCGSAYGYHDRAGTAVMNCTGFVWHALWKSLEPYGVTYQSAYQNIPCWGGIGAGNWRDYLRNNRIQYTTYYAQNNDPANINGLLDDILNDDQLQPGDIMWIWDTGTIGMASDGLPSGSSPHHHIGIYTGNHFDGKHADSVNWLGAGINQWWQSIGESPYTGTNYQRNVVDTITPKAATYAITVISLEPGKGSVELWKKSSDPSVTDGNGNYSLAGAEYGVYLSGHGDSPVAVITTDANGYGKADGIPAGDYWLKELTAPKGFEIDTTAHYVQVTGNTTATATVTDIPIPTEGWLELVKASANPEITNNNSCYSLKDAEYGVYSDKNCTKKVTSLITNESGYAKSGKLNIGTYYVKEIKAPVGYAKDTAVYTAAVKTEVTVRVNVKDYPQSNPVSILLGKVDKETDQNKPQGSASLKDAEFTVKYYAGFYDANPEKQGVKATRSWVLRTKADGKTGFIDTLKISGDEFYRNSAGSSTLPLGTVTIQETKAPEGYLLNDEVFVRQITSKGTAENVETYNEQIIQEQSLNLDIVKIIKGTNLVIPGVRFRHTLPDGTTQTVTTDADGQASIKGLTRGTHTIEEEYVPDGYTKNPGKGTFIVSEDNSIKITGNTSVAADGNMTFTVRDAGGAGLTVEDTYAPYTLKLVKENESKKRLQGAEFTLYADKKCTQEVTKGVTGEDGTLEFVKLQVETIYFLKETKAPKGYRLPVNDDGSDVVTEICTQSNPQEDLFECYVNGKKYTETEGRDTITGSKSNRVVNMTVVNHTGNQLPETGTHLTLTFAIAGVLCMAGTMAYSTKRKRGKE